MHGFLGSLIWREVLFLHDALYVFYHHDGVVDHYTYGKHQSEQSKHIQREAEDKHKSECTDKRDGDGHQRDEGSTPALQREVHHEDNQDEGFKQSLVYFMN